MEKNELNHSSEMVALDFQYSDEDFIYTTTNSHNHEGKSLFDVLLKTKWKAAREAGLFNYRTDNVETKVLPGKCNIIAQLNANRSKMRRKPEEILSVTQPSDPTKFNFTKIRCNEVLAEIQHVKNSNKEFQPEGANEHGTSLHGSLVINTAPICFSHSLLVPFLSELRPQVLDQEGLVLAVHCALLSHTPDFRIAFNSLAGFASVNHLHFHLYYLPYHLYIETAECTKIAGPCYAFDDYHAPGFVFQLENNDVQKLVSSVMAVVKVFLEEEIAHNIFITRGNPLESPSALDTYSTLRLIIWGRKPSYGMKDVSVFAAAVCELAGHVPVYSDDRWCSLTEDDIIPTLKEACLETYESLLPKVKKLFI